MYLTSAPWWLRMLYPPGITWQFSTTNREIFLTFDDGPVPEITTEVLGILDKYGIKATFFCVGENVVRHPEIFSLLKSMGHTVGNHTFHHARSWKMKADDYLQEADECRRVTGSRLFRPPHGQLTPKAARMLLRNYQVVMWTGLSADFDPSITGEQCLANAVKHTRPGAIIVFHDSLKARSRLIYALPRYLEYCLSEGYRFSVPADNS